MPPAQTGVGAKTALASREDLQRLVGDVDERKSLDILALHPTIAEIEQVALWSAGDGDILAKSGCPLSGTAAQVLEILVADEEEELPPAR